MKKSEIFHLWIMIYREIISINQSFLLNRPLFRSNLSTLFGIIDSSHVCWSSKHNISTVEKSLLYLYRNDKQFAEIDQSYHDSCYP